MEKLIAKGKNVIIYQFIGGHGYTYTENYFQLMKLLSLHMKRHARIEYRETGMIDPSTDSYMRLVDYKVFQDSEHVPLTRARADMGRGKGRHITGI